MPKANPVDASPSAVCRRRYKALRDEGYNHEFCNFAMVAADTMDALAAERDRLDRSIARQALGLTAETPIASRGQCPKCSGYFPAAGGTVGPHECLGSETVVKPKPKPDWHGSQSGDGYSCYTCGAFTLRLDDIASVEKDCTKCDSTK